MSDEDPTSTFPPALGRFIPWLQALGVAAIGAFVVAALEVGLSLLTGEGGVGPWTRDGLAHMARAGLAAAIVVAIAYVRQAPAGMRKEWSEEERAAQRATLAAQGRLPAAPPAAVVPTDQGGRGTPPPRIGDGTGGSI